MIVFEFSKQYRVRIWFRAWEGLTVRTKYNIFICYERFAHFIEMDWF
jgi:hypothetical protein